LAGSSASRAGKKTNLAKPLEKISEAHKKRSLVVIISDLLDDEETSSTHSNTFANKGHELLVFHLYDKSEEEFDSSVKRIQIDRENL